MSPPGRTRAHTEVLELRYESPNERLHALIDRWLEELGDYGELTVRVEKHHGRPSHAIRVNSEERRKID